MFKLKNHGWNVPQPFIWAVRGTKSSGISSKGSINVYDNCWQIEVSKGANEDELGVVPKYLKRLGAKLNQSTSKISKNLGKNIHCLFST